MSLNINQIRIDGGTQSRAAINDATVAEYAEAMADPVTVFPPVIVYFDGKDYWLADGFHRLAAWRQIGRTEIPTEIRQGDRRRAILHSVAANSAHGLRRTNEDKRRAVLTLLEDEEWGLWSDREIARRCAVSPSFVGGLRGASVHGGQIAEPRKVERNGTVYQQNTANIGAASKVDQETPSQQAQAEVSGNRPDLPAASKVDQKTAASAAPSSAEDAEIAKVKRELAKMTAEGVAGLVMELREALSEAKADRVKLKAEVAKLKDTLKQFDGDKDQAIKNLSRTIEHKNSEMFRANEKAQAALRANYALKKRIEELEKMGVVTL